MVPLQVWNSLLVDEERERLRQIRHLLIGGGPVNDRLADALADFPNAVWSTYGMTETLSHIALRRLSGPERSAWYTPFSGVSVSLDGDGCLAIDAPQVCPQRLVTRDLAEIREAERGGQVVRQFRILGRKDNVVCTGGVKVQIEEVERKLAGRLAVPFLVTKCTDERLGEAVVMLVEGEADGAAVSAVCRCVLTRFEQPRHVFSVTKLPLTATGKPARAEAERMAEMMAAEG